MNAIGALEHFISQVTEPFKQTCTYLPTCLSLLRLQLPDENEK